MLMLLLLSCAKQPPQSIWPTDPPALEEPELVPFEPAEDEIPLVMPYLPGQTAPYTDESCTVTNRALLIPESKAADLYQEGEIKDWWKERALICHDYRMSDRAYCDQVVKRVHEDLEFKEREARWIRWAIPVSLTVGIVIGATSYRAGVEIWDKL